MSIKQEMADMAAALQQPPTVVTKRAERNISAPAAMVGLSTGFKDLQAEVKNLRETKGQAIRVPLEACDDGPYHTSPLDPERVANLRANLAENDQSTPALVRAKGDGRFEILAGRHRKAALAELGKTEWDVVIRDFDDDAAERLTFYDNLLAPSLTDYAKYRGFAHRKESKGYSLEQLAKEAGVSKGMVAGLMSFAKLPPEAIAIIEEKQKQFGYNMIAKLAQLVDDHRDAVIKVVGQIAAGQLKQEDAERAVLAEPAISGRATTTSAQAKPSRVTVEWGGKEYATVDVSNKRLTITLADKGEADAARKAVMKALEDRAKKVAK